MKNKELSTPCEADGNLCTNDHCDGVGSCVLKDNVDCSGLNDQCQEGVCNPSDGQCYPDYTKYPWSTPCEADSSKCTIDHCNGSGSCVFKENVPIPPAQECKSFYCDPTDGKIKENYTAYPLSTPCNADDKFCTVDHCDGKGTCVYWKDYDCSGYDLKEIAQCNWIPDNYLATFDYSQAFTSTCDEVNDECTEGSQPLTHTCADTNASDGGPIIPVGNGIRTCDAECDGFGIECQNYCINDIRYFNGKLYERLGFEFKENTQPNYFYFNYKNDFVLKSRLQFQKHKLPAILDKFDKNLSEWENMKLNGYNRIWDCGNKKYVKYFNTETT